MVKKRSCVDFLLGVVSLQNGSVIFLAKTKKQLTRSSQSLRRPGEGWAQPPCGAFELQCHFVVTKNHFLGCGGWPPYKMIAYDLTGEGGSISGLARQPVRSGQAAIASSV